MTHDNGIDTTVTPSGSGCVECLRDGTWWFHLRRCAKCGHIGCCDTSPHRHATAHHHATKHPIITSFEPGEVWFFDYRTGDSIEGPALASPDAHPPSQPTPGPSGRVPADWQSKLNG